MLANCSVFHALLTNLTVPEVGAASSEELAVTLEGAQIGDLVLFSPRQANASPIAFGAGRVTAADTLALRFTNASAAASTPPATDDYDVWLIRSTGSLSTATPV